MSRAKPHVVTTRSVMSWVLYDLANTIFSMSIVSLYFSLGTLFEGRPEIGQPVGILTLPVMIVVAYWILRPVSDRKRDWTGDDLI